MKHQDCTRLCNIDTVDTPFVHSDLIFREPVRPSLKGFLRMRWFPNRGLDDVSKGIGGGPVHIPLCGQDLTRFADGRVDVTLSFDVFALTRRGVQRVNDNVNVMNALEERPSETIDLIHDTIVPRSMGRDTLFSVPSQCSQFRDFHPGARSSRRPHAAHPCRRKHPHRAGP